MRPNSTLRSWLGVLLILAGVLLGLVLSAYVTWAQSEAGLLNSYNADRTLKLHCPVMLAHNETGTISATISNLINESITPTVSAQISHAGKTRRLDQIVPLKPHASQKLEWTVDSTDVMYQYLVLVDVLQLRYRDNPSMLGSCGILLFSLFGLNGSATFGLLLAVSLVALVMGAMLWARVHPVFDNYAFNLRRAGVVLITITMLALLSIFPRWWWLTLVLDGGIVLMIGVLFTEFMLFPGKYKG
jgi:hypothetical protein